MAKTLIEKTANKLVDAFINNKIIAPLPSKFTRKLKHAEILRRLCESKVNDEIIGFKADIPEELNDIDDELKAIYHSKDTVCFYIFKTRDLRNEFVEKTKGMEKTQREEIYKQYLI